MYPVAGAASLVLSTFVVAGALLLIDHWSRWLPLAAVVTGFPVLTLNDPVAEALTAPQKLTWSIYAAATEAAACLLLYGLARLTQVCVALQEARQQYAEAAATQERLRLARDTHDTLGLGLSTIALKTDLAAALADRDPVRARHEAAQALHLTALVANDVTAIASGQLRLDLTTELATAEHSLHAAGIEASIRRPDSDLGLTGATESALAAVLREAVTNVLRHSRARTCTIVLTRTGDLVTLEVANDGVTPAGSSEPGQGLANVSARLRDIDGTLRTLLRDSRFTLTATALPEPPEHRDSQLIRAQA